MIRILLSIITLIVIIITTMFQYAGASADYKFGASEPQGNLEYEYRRYTYVLKILNCIRENKTAMRKNYEIRNIVERWLLSMVNFSDDLFDSIFSNDILVLDCRFNKQMMGELKDKTRFTSDDINKIMRRIINIVGEYKNVMADQCTDADFELTSDTFTYREYKRKIAPERLKFLLTRGTKYQLARMLLRYASILPGAQHWNMPKDNFQTYYNRGITVEGFASPINAQLITIDPKCQFCSLFPDVDAPFGSIGNFFQTNFIGKNVAVGPPYTEELFDKIAKKLSAECQKAEDSNMKVLFYVTFAAWADTDGFKAIRDSKWCHQAALLPKWQHYYVNTNKQNQPKVTASFNTVFFDVSVGHRPLSMDNLFDNMSNNMKLQIIK